MKYDYLARMSLIMEKLDRLTMGRLAIEREINRGERMENFYKERLAEVSECKGQLFNIAVDIASLVGEIVEHNEKFQKACQDPQVEELWQVIETAMTMVK